MPSNSDPKGGGKLRYRSKCNVTSPSLSGPLNLISWAARGKLNNCNVIVICVYTYRLIGLSTMSRGCPGIRFACLEMKIMLIKLLMDFDFAARDADLRFVCCTT